MSGRKGSELAIASWKCRLVKPSACSRAASFLCWSSKAIVGSNEWTSQPAFAAATSKVHSSPMPMEKTRHGGDSSHTSQSLAAGPDLRHESGAETGRIGRSRCSRSSAQARTSSSLLSTETSVMLYLRSSRVWRRRNGVSSLVGPLRGIQYSQQALPHIGGRHWAALRHDLGHCAATAQAPVARSVSRHTCALAQCRTIIVTEMARRLSTARR